MAAALILGSIPSPIAAVDPVPAPSDAPTPIVPRRPTDGLTLSQPTVADPGDFAVPHFQEEVVFEGLNLPIVVEFAPDGRVFVGEKSGVIKVFDSLNDHTPSVYANISTSVHDYWDRGLLGMALDPNFASNGRLYVAYTYDRAIGGGLPDWGNGCPNPPGDNTDGCVVAGHLSVIAPGGAETVLIEDWCQQFPSHSMSDIVFDAEGALIVNGGDGANFNVTDYGQFGGSAGSPIQRNPCGDPPGGVGGAMSAPSAEGGALRSQDRRTSADPLGLNGSVIRVNPANGSPMSDNPSTTGSLNNRRMVGYGLRNPFRMAVHPVTGDVWIGDVGWGTWEEINHLDPDGTTVPNFGWPCREGNGTTPNGAYNTLSLCQNLVSGWTGPDFTYSHSSEVVSGDGCGGGGSISGLAFYPGGPYPAAYDNALFFTDYSRSCLWVLPSNGSGGVNTAQRAHFAELANPVHLTVGPGGNLYYVDIGGTIRRIIYLGANNDAPTAVIDADQTSGERPLAVEFDASGSSDPDGDALQYAWDFGDDDGLYDDAFVVSPSHTYTTGGTFTARVRVTDGQGGSDVATVDIDVDNTAPTAFIDTPSESLRWSVGQQISFSGHATDPDGAVPTGNMTWQLIMHHCSASDCHEHPIKTFSGQASGTFAAPDHEYPSHLSLRLTVTDPQGASGSTEIDLDPATVTLRIRSAPTGMTVSAGWVTDVTPFDMTVIKGSAILLSATGGQPIDGFPSTWTSWSDGKPRIHSVTASTSATYTATFDAGYDDVPPGAKFRADIAWMTREGITSGCSDAPPLYCPNGLVTRGQMATFLTRALHLPATSTDYFTDDETSIHESSINRLRAAGITVGCTATAFCPSGIVTRGQMATFLTRGLGLPTTSTDYFTDDEANRHEPNINRLRAAAITFGCGPSTYCPDGSVTRGQMAAFLHRALED
ncbi:MAG TPA: PQQ-dependent sugar dehydrogenase [Candidatus Limnocylindria bacterium]